MSPKKMVAKDSAAKRKKDTISIELKIIGKHKRGLRVANLAKLHALHIFCFETHTTKFFGWFLGLGMD